MRSHPVRKKASAGHFRVTVSTHSAGSFAGWDVRHPGWGTRDGACRGRTTASVRLSAWLTASSGAQLRSRSCASDNPFGGQSMDRRLWTEHHGVTMSRSPLPHTSVRRFGNGTGGRTGAGDDRSARRRGRLARRALGQEQAAEAVSGDKQPPLIPLYDSSVEPEDFTGPYVLLASRTENGTVTGAVIPAADGIAVRGFRTPAGGTGL